MVVRAHQANKHNVGRDHAISLSLFPFSLSHPPVPRSRLPLLQASQDMAQIFNQAFLPRYESGQAPGPNPEHALKSQARRSVLKRKIFKPGSFEDRGSTRTSCQANLKPLRLLLSMPIQAPSKLPFKPPHNVDILSVGPYTRATSSRVVFYCQCQVTFQAHPKLPSKLPQNCRHVTTPVPLNNRCGTFLLPSRRSSLPFIRSHRLYSCILRLYNP